MNGLWTAEFASTAGIFGSGVAIFLDGQILGGDHGYTFIGTYDISGETFMASIEIEPFIHGTTSVFNTIDRRFTLKIQGSIFATEGIGHGYPVEFPGLRISIKLKKKKSI